MRLLKGKLQSIRIYLAYSQVIAEDPRSQERIVA